MPDAALFRLRIAVSRLAGAVLLALACGWGAPASASSPQQTGEGVTAVHPVCFIADPGPGGAAFLGQLCRTTEAILKARGHPNVSLARVGDDRMADPSRLFVVLSARDQGGFIGVAVQTWQRGVRAERIIPVPPIFVSPDLSTEELTAALTPLLRELGL